VVAEGVEKADILQRLKKLGCDDVQGYFFSRPVPASELPAVVAVIEQDLTALNTL